MSWSLFIDEPGQDRFGLIFNEDRCGRGSDRTPLCASWQRVHARIVGRRAKSNMPLMPDDTTRLSYGTDLDQLPEGVPVHRHDPLFWAALGRVVATFGFLEETLGKAIFAITATTEYDDAAMAAAVEKWGGTVEKALTDPLGAKINGYEKAVRAHTSVKLGNLDWLFDDLRRAAEVRNALCHGSWRLPDANGASVPFFVDRKLRRFETKVDIAFLDQVQRHAIELSVVVMNSVTGMGWQFPGSGGPGEPIWQPGGAPA